MSANRCLKTVDRYTLAIAKHFYDSEHPNLRLYNSNLAALPPAPSQ